MLELVACSIIEFTCNALNNIVYFNIHCLCVLFKSLDLLHTPQTNQLTYLQNNSKHSNWHINNPFVRPSRLMLGSTKGGNLPNVTTHNVIWANQKTESFVYRWLLAHAMFDVTCFPAFSDVIPHVPSVC